MENGVYGVLLLSVLLATGNNAMLHSLYGKKYDGFLFNAIVALVWSVSIGAFAALRGFALQEVTIFYALGYGVTLSGFIFFKSKAMSTGPVSLTALVGCSSFIVTTIFNAVYWKETVRVVEWLGVACMAVAVLLVTYKKESGENKMNGKWLLSALGFFSFSAATGILFRFHQSVDKASSDEMMAMASLFASLVIFLLYICTRKKETGQEKSAFPLGVAIACGGLACGYNRLNLYLSGALASKLFFPLFNGGVVLCSFFAGWLLFKEKITKTQAIGVGIGAISILLIGNFFGLIS